MGCFYFINRFVKTYILKQGGILLSVLKIRKIEIHDFRCFKNISFNLGKVITVIAGHNATGKSTILGLLGHCAELKPKDGRPILQKLFRTEFSEIITASESFDPRNPKVYTIYFSQDNDIPVEPMTFRTTWQKYKDKARFRIIPKPIPTRKEQKLRWPVLYLGLSRLYPIGESEQVTTSKSGLNPEQKQKYFSTYKKILSLNEDPIDCSAITIQETTKKKTVGVTTDKYDSLCNSAGQDNLSQILLAVMSFEVLKEQCGELTCTRFARHR
jgi:predicted ATP-dependent endonuclease of OLD family